MNTKTFTNRAAKAALFAGILCAGILSLGTGGPRAAMAQSDEFRDIAFSLAILLRGGHEVISDAQPLINDASIGDKGLTSERVVQETIFYFEIDTGIRIADIPANSLHGRLVQALLDATAEVTEQWQDVINVEGIGYKGFLPATFAMQVADSFGEKATGIAEIKLTGPNDFVRNPLNLPDSWESAVIEDQFRSDSHVYGREVFRQTVSNGQPAHRLMLPEYYMQSCLSCHGGTEGEIDMTGGPMEGGTLGEVGGAISVTIYGRG